MRGRYRWECTKVGREEHCTGKKGWEACVAGVQDKGVGERKNRKMKTEAGLPGKYHGCHDQLCWGKTQLGLQSRAVGP